MKDTNFDETKKAVSQAIDENFVCFAEDHTRNLEYQLDQIQREQGYLREWVNETMNPSIQEIRDTLREQKESKNDNHRSSDG